MQQIHYCVVYQFSYMPSCTELEMPKFNLNTLVGSNKPGSDTRLAGPWFNIRMSYQYRKSHCGDKTVARSSYHHNRISYTGKRTSLYWIRTLAFKKFMQSVEKNQTEKLHSDHRICNCDPKSTFRLHVSLFSCLTAWKKLSISSLTAVWELSNSWPY